MEKLTRTAGKLDIFFRVLFWFFVIVFGVLTVAAALTLAQGGALPTGGAYIECSPFRLTVSEEYAAGVDFTGVAICALVQTVIGGGVVLYAIGVIRAILAPAKNGEPFAASVPGNLKKLGWAVLISGGISFIVGMASTVLVARSVDFDAVFNRSTVVTVDTFYMADMTFVIVAALLFLLSYIFRCGEQLQRQADETL